MNQIKIPQKTPIYKILLYTNQIPVNNLILVQKSRKNEIKIQQKLPSSVKKSGNNYKKNSKMFTL